MFKKIISLFAVSFIIIHIFTINVFADDEYDEPMSSYEYRSSQSWLISEYAKGRYTWDEFYEQSQSVTNRYLESNTVNNVISPTALSISNSMSAIVMKMGNVVNSLGDSAANYINSLINDLFSDYEHTRQESTTDRQGYGAMMVIYQSGTDIISSIIYCEYIVIVNEYNYWYYGDGYTHYLTSDRKDYFYYSSSGSYGSQLADPRDIKLYGDIRYYKDGSPAPTDDEFIEVPEYKFDNASDKDLDDLLKRLLAALTLQSPDLSNVEGLLQAIYYRLGTLDSDNDNELLSQINAAIITLAEKSGDSNSGVGGSNSLELIQALVDLKEALKSSDGVYDKELFQDMADNIKDISLTLKGLALLEVSDNLLDLTDSEAKLFDEYANLIPVLVNKVGFAAVSSVMFDIESVIFMSRPPSDLTIEIYGEEYVLLSSSMFTSESMRYINIAKTFASVLLIYTWCMLMRKKLAWG